MDGVVPIYSVAKIFTAAAALLLFEESDPIGSLTSVAPRFAGITVGDLLTHRSGLGDYGAWPDYADSVARRGTPWPAELLLDRVTMNPPGQFHYSNIGYFLIRRALEDACGGTFFEALDNAVLEPLGVSAFPFEHLEDWGRCAPSTVPDVSNYHPGWVYSGTFAATVNSAARGLSRLMSGGLGDIGSRMARTYPVAAPGHPWTEPGYGSGLMTDGRPPTVVGHGGDGPGFTLFVASTIDGRRARGVAVPAEIGSTGLVVASDPSLGSPQ
ncbi:serine hydrolase [Nocardia sp. NPDC005978]|uniref:serine hydrolase domain-containing protein n=1 Tax=Nocardia sp. NPDC005978 TaxID=3156725 RepID=UPI0033B7480C